jgi:Xaa-Pro aminopeptidase
MMTATTLPIPGITGKTRSSPDGRDDGRLSMGSPRRSRRKDDSMIARSAHAILVVSIAASAPSTTLAGVPPISVKNFLREVGRQQVFSETFQNSERGAKYKIVVVNGTSYTIAEAEAAIEAAKGRAKPEELAPITARVQKAKEARDRGDLREAMEQIEDAMAELEKLGPGN